MKLFKKEKGKKKPKSTKSLSKKRLSFLKNLGKFLLNSIGIMTPLLILVVAIPYGIQKGSSILEPFFKATNFTITDPTSAFTTLAKQPELRQDTNGFTNVLLVGIDTRPSSSSTLKNTDTMIIASYNHKTNEVAMLSFPRDINVKYPGTSSVGKINSTYAYGERRKTGTGMEYLKKVVEEISGLQIHYHAMVDLKGFITVIDKLGGVDVKVDTAFSGHYPTWQGGWEHVKFSAGMQHMSGARALKYARIRYAYPGSEASDFARAARQQKVIDAAITKATKAESLQNTKTIFEILKAVAKNIKINRVTPQDIEAGLQILIEEGKPKTYSLVLDPSAGGSYSRLITRAPGYMYNLQPSAGSANWSVVRPFLQDYFKVPMLVTTSRKVYLYNNGKSNFSSIVTSLRNRYYYATFANGGAPKTLPDKGVYYTGGENFIPMCEYFARKYKTECLDPSTTEVKVPTPKDSAIAIVLKD